MSGYKLYYFNVRGRGELARLAFAAANIEFEDIRLTKDEWAIEKASKSNMFSYRIDSSLHIEIGNGDLSKEYTLYHSFESHVDG